MADTVQRKLTTILCADVQGYSHLMEVDEEATLATLKGYREAMTGLMERHQGRLVSTSGDSVLGEFSSVVEALQCAVEIQRELAARNLSLDGDRRMEFRIGLNIGDVMVEGDDIYGEGVNVAARLEELAEPGGICISGTVYDQVHDKLTLGYDYLGERLVKNISKEVRVYRVALGEADGAKEDRSKIESAPSVPSRTSSSETAAVPSLRNFYQSVATCCVIVSFLFVIDWWRGGGWWVHWVALIAGFVLLLKGVKLLFGHDSSNSSTGTVMRHQSDWSNHQGVITGDYVYARNTNATATVGGSVTVKPGITVNFKGVIGRDLVIEQDAIINLHGSVGGDVHNKGGTLNLTGNVMGREIQG